MKSLLRGLKNRRHLLVLIFLCLAGFWWRISNLSSNYSFWTDEDHVAIFSRAILERGTPVLSNGYSTGSFQSLWYWITAFSMKVFGINEFAARIPSVAFGVLSIWAIYLLAAKLFGKNVGLVSSLFTAFLNIEILWSRQARPYQALQFIYLLEIYLFLLILEGGRKRKIWCFLALEAFLIVAGSLMHWFGLLPVVVFFVYFFLFRFPLVKQFGRGLLQKIKNKPLVWGGLVAIVLVTFGYILKSLGFFAAAKGIVFPAFNKVGFYNHVAYYHSFLWRQYGLLIFLSLIGVIVSLIKDYKRSSLLLTFIAVFLILVNFRLRVPFSRYLYPIFPIIIILASFGLSVVSESLERSLSNKLIFLKKWIFGFLAIFIVFNGYKFSIKPKPFYSLNADMQEIPEVDFKEIYKYISDKTENIDDWVLVSTWTDHATWYLGESKPEYWLRDKKVTYGEERDLLSRALIIGSLEEFKTTVRAQPKGIAIIESWEPYIPEEVEDYIKMNFKKEIEVDRIYPVQPRYWPVNVYSWGF